MSCTLEAFAADCKAKLITEPGPGGREKIREMLERVLADDEFMRTHFGNDRDSERNVLYRDPELGFCIVAHTYTERHCGESAPSRAGLGHLRPSGRDHGNDGLEARAGTGGRQSRKGRGGADLYAQPR